MGSTVLQEVEGPVVSTLSKEQEDIRLNAFFLHIGDPEKDPPGYILGTHLCVARGGRARDGWEWSNRAGGGSETFLRIVWLSAHQGLITFGFTDGCGFTELWKATFDADDRLVEAVTIGTWRSSRPIGRLEARALWHRGRSVPV